MKIIKSFKSFSIAESENSEIGYRTFFLVPIGTRENYCKMDFELTPISTSMPDVEESTPGQCWNDYFEATGEDCDEYEEGTAEWEDCKDRESNTGEWDTVHSVGYGKIFIATFLLPLGQNIKVSERGVDDDETIEDIIAELKKDEEGLVSLYNLKNPDQEDGGYDEDDYEYDFDLIGGMFEAAKTNLKDVAVSLSGCSKSIKEDFNQMFAENDIEINATFEDMKVIRDHSPEIFQIIRNKISSGADVSADLGELGF